MIEKDSIITENAKIAETMYTFFSEGVNNNVCNVGYESEIVVNVNQIISKFKEHPSVKKIKEKANYANEFSFTLCSLDEMRKRINMLNTTKPTT